MHLVAYELRKIGYFGKRVIVYVYDVYSQAFPHGVPFGSSPPEDFTGDLHGSPQLKNAGIPKIYFIGHDNRSTPFMQYSGIGLASSILDWVKANSSHNLSKIDTEKLAMYNPDEKRLDKYGRRKVDNIDFFRIIKAEGVITPMDPSSGNPIDWEENKKPDDEGPDEEKDEL